MQSKAHESIKERLFIDREQWDRASGAAHIVQRKSGEMARGRSPLSFSTVSCALKHFHRARAHERRKRCASPRRIILFDPQSAAA